MDALLLAYYYSLPYVMALAAAGFLVVLAGAAWRFPLMPALVYLSVIFAFSSSRYGMLENASSTLYTRGSGQLFFPALMWMLMLGAIWMSFAHRTSIRSQAAPSMPAAPIQKWFWLWFLLLLCHVCVGLLVEQPLSEVLDSNGFLQMPVIGLLVALLVAGASGGKSTASLALFVELAALAKSLFGLVRWAAFGGDPANVYANVEKLAVKLTFFEIGDSLICLLGIAVAASLLFVRRPQSESPLRTALHWAVLLLGMACVVLSFRRTAWLGLLIGFVWLLWHLKPAQRLLAIGLAAPVLLGAIGYVTTKRLGAQTSHLGVVGGFFHEILSSKSTGESPRVLELKLAADEFFKSPLWGNGAWGRYAATTQIGWQDPLRPGNFLHSGLLHLTMKTGLIGLVLLGGVIGSFVRGVRRAGDENPHDAALLAAACMGLLFMLPDFLGGTPTVQFRTMQLIGVCLALPFFVARAQAARRPD
jgi:hypothetical protein